MLLVLNDVTVSARYVVGIKRSKVKVKSASIAVVNITFQSRVFGAYVFT